MGTKTEKHISKANKANGITEKKCPVCYHSEMTVFFEVESAPVFCNVLWNNRDEAIASPRAPVHLAYCHDCELIYNVAFEPQLMEYSPAYENSLHFSPRFQKYAEEMANQLIRQYQLRDKDIIEIGCGHGDFLTLLCELGGNRGIGFEPSYTLEKAETGLENSEVIILPEAYSQEHAKYPIDFICCRHVLEHIDSPLDFLKNIRNVIGQRYDCIVYFEVPNALYIFKNMGVWDIIYEHCSYFTLESLTNLFVRASFEPIKVAEQYDGQFLTIEARTGTTNINSTSGYERIMPDTNNLIRKFHNAYRKKVNSWQHTLSQFKKQQTRVVVWGAGSKGVAFLNALDISHQQIKYVIDLNPRKQGKFVAGTGQQVVAPDFLKEYRPQTVIIMNPIYHVEIQQLIKDFGINAELIDA